VDAGTGDISTVAGGGPGCTEPCPAIQQALSAPSGVAAPSSEGIYIADRGNHRVRWVDGTGAIRTVAGTGAPGLALDGTAATSAPLNYPSAVEVDAAGHLMISDQGNHLVWAVTPGDDSIVNGLAGEFVIRIAGGGNPTPGFCGDWSWGTEACLDTPAGISYHDLDKTLYIADQANQRVRKLPSDSDMDGLLDRVEDTNHDNDYDPEIDFSDLRTTDTDGDGCADSEDVGLGLSPKAWYDFFDAPVPARSDAVGPNGPRNRLVDMSDVLGVLLYVFADDNGPANGNGVDYDSDKGVDTNGDTTADIPPDGLEDGLGYDRSPGLPPSGGADPAGEPNGVVDIGDVLAALAQAYLADCTLPP
jgi:hypothetical protein